MRKSFSVLVILAALAMFTQSALAGVEFSVFPGQQFGSSTLGIELGPIGVYGSLDAVGVGFDFDATLSRTGEDDEKIDLAASGTVLIPAVGGKIKLASSGKVVPYVRGGVGLAKPSIKITSEALGDGLEDLQDSINEALEKVETMAFHGAFGMEYVVSDSFSVAGETGLRYLRSSLSEEFSEDYGEVIATLETNLAGHLKATYSSIGLVYRF